MGVGYDKLSREELIELLEGVPHEPIGRLSESGYREIVQEAADGIFISDERGTYIDVNEMGARMLGLTREQVIGQPIGAFTSLGPSSTPLQQILDGDLIRREWHMRRADGSTFTGEVAAKVLPGGRIQGILRDVSLRKEREEQLRRSAERFRAFTAASFEGIGISEKGIVVDVNEQLAHMLGYSRDELIGVPVSTFVAPESLEAATAHMRSGSDAVFPHVALRKDGSRLHVETQAKQTEWGGRMVRITAIRDVTERLHAEAVLREVEQRRKELELHIGQTQKLEALGRFAGGIAHDFNNILLAIYSYCDLTEADASVPELVESHVVEMRLAADRARDLVQQILSFSSQRPEAPRLLDLRPIVAEALKFLRATLPRGVVIKDQLDADAPRVLGTSTGIHQVLMNLCINAAQAMSGGGLLTLEVSTAVDGAELSRFFPDAAARRYARLRVSDTGSGMDETTLARVFEPFFTTKREGEGTGLGLAVVYGIVQAHDGAIGVSSVVGAGTVFTVYLPEGPAV